MFGARKKYVPGVQRGCVLEEARLRRNIRSSLSHELMLGNRYPPR